MHPQHSAWKLFVVPDNIISARTKGREYCGNSFSNHAGFLLFMDCHNSSADCFFKRPEMVNERRRTYNQYIAVCSHVSLRNRILRAGEDYKKSKVMQKCFPFSAAWCIPMPHNPFYPYCRESRFILQTLYI